MIACTVVEAVDSGRPSRSTVNAIPSLQVFQPDKALCHQRRDSCGTTRPGQGDCRPLECGNVALSTDNITALRAELNRVGDELAVRPSLPPLLQHRLRSRRDQITHFLDRHTPETA